MHTMYIPSKYVSTMQLEIKKDMSMHVMIIVTMLLHLSFKQFYFLCLIKFLVSKRILSVFRK